MAKPNQAAQEPANRPDTEPTTEEPKEAPQLLLKVTASIAADRTKDKKARKVKRYLPWATPAQFAADPKGTLESIQQRVAAARAAGKISGITTEGEIVADEPFTHDGIGQVAKNADRGTLSFERFWVFFAKGITLAQQQQMQTLMVERFGDPEAPKKNGSKPEDAETI